MKNSRLQIIWVQIFILSLVFASCGGGGSGSGGSGNGGNTNITGNGGNPNDIGESLAYSSTNGYYYSSNPQLTAVLTQSRIWRNPNSINLGQRFPLDAWLKENGYNTYSPGPSEFTKGNEVMLPNSIQRQGTFTNNSTSIFTGNRTLTFKVNEYSDNDSLSKQGKLFKQIFYI